MFLQIRKIGRSCTCKFARNIYFLLLITLIILEEKIIHERRFLVSKKVEFRIEHDQESTRNWTNPYRNPYFLIWDSFSGADQDNCVRDLGIWQENDCLNVVFDVVLTGGLRRTGLIGSCLISSNSILSVKPIQSFATWWFKKQRESLYIEPFLTYQGILNLFKSLDAMLQSNSQTFCNSVDKT